MPDNADKPDPVNFDSVRFDELGRSPIIGRESDRELLFDLPGTTPVVRQVGTSRRSIEREFLTNDFAHGY